MDSKQHMTIDVFADVVCPWCYIGKRRLERALEMRPDVEVTCRWHPFQLNPDMPMEGISWDSFVREKFGGPKRARSLFERVSRSAAADGLDLRFDHIHSSPNTLDAHRLILWATGHGKEWEMADALFLAHFTQGRDIGDREVLAAIAGEQGLSSEEAHALLESNAGTAEVKASQSAAYSIGIQGVPFFIIDERYGVSGAQPVDVFLEVFNDVAGAAV
jgi:predicted DsbA family dithiol-disulfide isomerase